MNENTLLSRGVSLGDRQPDKSSKWKPVVVGGISAIALGGVSTIAVGATASRMSQDAEDDSADPMQDGAAEVSGAVVGGVPTATVGAAVGHAKDDADNVDTPLTKVTDSVFVDSSVPVAHVSDDMTFSEAFHAAHEQVGEGGVFVWRGQVYNTFSADEWNALTPAEQAQFGGHIHVQYNGEQALQLTPEPLVEVEHEVEILGVEVVHTENGDLTLGGVTVNGEEYVLVDVNGGDFDVARRDNNHDMRMQDTEPVDIRDEHVSVKEFAKASIHDDGHSNVGHDDNMRVENGMGQMEYSDVDYVDNVDAPDVDACV